MTTATTAPMQPIAEAIVPDLEIGRTIDTLANNPLRSLAYLAVAAAQRPLTPSEQVGRLRELQENEPGWRFTDKDPSIVRSACKNVLEPGGLLVPAVKENGALAYTSKTSSQSEHAAVAGALIDWELQFPDRSLALALGEAKPGLDQGMPQTALQLYEKLLNQPDGNELLSTLLSAANRPKGTTERIIQLLQQRRILEKHATRAPIADRTLTIQRPRDNYLRLQGKKLRGISVAVFRASMRVLETGGDTVSMQRLATLTAAQDPAYGVDALCKAFEQKLPVYLSYAGDTRVRLAIAEEARGAIADLALRVRLLKTDPAFRERAAERAFEILSSPPDVAALLAKSRERMMPTARPSREEQNRRRLGSLTLIQLHTRRNWRQGAACTPNDTEFFYPEDRATYGDYGARARAICETCPVSHSCFQWALDHRQQHGIFGGMTADERRLHLKKKPGVPENNVSYQEAAAADREVTALFLSIANRARKKAA